MSLDAPPPVSNGGLLPVDSSLASGPFVPAMTPSQQISHYSPADWETFITEWLTGLKKSFYQVKRLGGPGDKGVDVAAFKTEREFEGAWECYQAKHYKDSLTFSDAFPEMLKIFQGVLDEEYCFPERYVLVSPKGCGLTLNRLLSKPTEHRKKFLEKLNEEKNVAKICDSSTLERIRELVKKTDFSCFRSLELHEMLDVHRKTPYYSMRFRTELPARPPIGQPTATPSRSETTYVAKLIEVYREQDPASCFDVSSVVSHVKHGRHFQRQRECFYSAEALRLYARDSVPDGTYERLQDDVYNGVIETMEKDYPSGLERLRGVLIQAGQLDLGAAHALISRSTIKDRYGICHQLANLDRLTWMISDE